MATQPVLVKFDDSVRTYSYYNDITDLKVGDTVVVYVRGTELKMAEVTKTVGLSRGDREKAHALIVQKIDTSGFKERQEALALVMEIKSQLKAAWEQQNEMDIYLSMAKSNPVIADLLQRLQEVSPGSVPNLLEEGKK